MTDQMQGRVLGQDHPCQTPNLDGLAAQGVRFRRAYTCNAVCSPARASLMTGLLPHNHGVLEVIHCVDDDQCNLRTDKPHWSQRFAEAGYRTGYFGKWHIERTNNLQEFGWQTDGGSNGQLYRRHRAGILGDSASRPRYSVSGTNNLPLGYDRKLLYGVTDHPPERRRMGITTSLAMKFLDEALQGPDPWCCFVSINEPHDPFITGQEAFNRYDVDALELPPNIHDDLSDRPGIYQKAARCWADMDEQRRREAAACYYASITEIDGQYGLLIDLLEEAGQLCNTIVVFTSDHGELLGAHGLYCKNFSAFEEVYNIPLVISGPGITEGALSDARVGIHDLCPTILELANARPIDVPDSRSFAPVLYDPHSQSGDFMTGYAEYHGGRYRLTQRVIWDGPWKFVFNGFDFDELYNLDDDPYEMCNLAENGNHQRQIRDLMALGWTTIRDTGDHALYNSHYPILRVAPFGPRILEESGP